MRFKAFSHASAAMSTLRISLWKPKNAQVLLRHDKGQNLPRTFQIRSGLGEPLRRRQSVVAIGQIQGGVGAPGLGHALPQRPLCRDAPNLVTDAVRGHEVGVGRSGHNVLHQGVGLGGKWRIVGPHAQNGLRVKAHLLEEGFKQGFTRGQGLFVGFQTAIRALGEVEVAHHACP